MRHYLDRLMALLSTLWASVPAPKGPVHRLNLVAPRVFRYHLYRCQSCDRPTAAPIHKGCGHRHCIRCERKMYALALMEQIFRNQDLAGLLHLPLKGSLPN